MTNFRPNDIDDMAPVTQNWRPATYAQALLAVLQDRGVEYLFVNAGTDWAPVVEALVVAREEGYAVPKLVAVPHENAAMAIAHGYYLATGRPQAVGVHNNVGTANAVCGLMNAARDNVPVLLLAGRTPYTESGSIASREVVVHWAQENFDQAAMVREHVKWDYELKSQQNPVEVIDRALDIAMTAPRGPVYLTLPREVLIESPPVDGITPRKRPFGALPPQPEAAAVEQLAQWVLEAKMPMIITSVAGRRTDTFNALSRLTEQYAIPLVQFFPRCLNLPADHAMHLGYQPNILLEVADLILVIDCEVPWIRRDQRINKAAKVAHIGVDPLYSSYPLRCFEDNFAITGASEYAVPMLLNSLNGAVSSAQEVAIQERREEISAIRYGLVQQSRRLASEGAKQNPLSPHWIASALAEIVDSETVIVNETGLCLDQLTLTQPGSLFIAPSVGGLGWSLGAGLGIKMAAPEKTVIVLLGDGSYMFGNPTPCHFIAASQNAPLLVVVANNAGWQAVDRAVRAVYPNGRAVQSGTEMPLVDLKPAPNFERIIEASGGYGERVEHPSDLPQALARGLHAVRVNKRQALLNLISQ